MIGSGQAVRWRTTRFSCLFLKIGGIAVHFQDHPRLPRNIPFLSLVVSISTILLISGCETSTSPEEPPPPDEPQYTLIDSRTIGAGGGTISDENLSIEIPAGALATDTEIDLYASKTDLPFGENSNTSTYKLEGISEFIEPIRVALRYEGILPDFPYVAHGTEQADLYDQETFVGYDLIAAADSSGFLVVHLPANSAGPGHLDPGGKNASNLQFLLGLMGFGEPIADDHFRIIYPNSVSNPEDILAFLMELRRIITDDLGFDYQGGEGCQGIIEPIQVNVGPMPRGLEVLPTNLRINKRNRRCTLTINEVFLDNGDTEISVAAGQDLLYVALSTKFGCMPQQYSFLNLWFIWAIREWSEEWFTVEEDYESPRRFSRNKFKLLEGIQLLRTGVPSTEYLAFANSMSAFVKYLTMEYGLTAPAVIVETAQSATSVFEGIATATGTGFGQIWRDFCDVYVKGLIYSVEVRDLVAQGAYQTPSRSWKIRESGDATHDFNGSSELTTYLGLEAKVFAIDFEFQDFGNSSHLRLSTSPQEEHEDLPMQVFGVTDDGLVQLIYNQTSANLHLQNELFANDIDRVIVLLVNEAYDLDDPQRSYTYDYLKCEIVQNYDYPSMYVRIFVNMTVYNQEEGVNEVWEQFGYYNQNLQGNITDDRFEYSEYESGGTWWRETTATGQIDLATGALMDFVIETNAATFNNEGVQVGSEHKKFDLISGLVPGFGYNVPMVAIGAAACTYIEDVEYSSWFEGGGYTYISPLTCDSQSYIRLEWYSQ